MFTFAQSKFTRLASLSALALGIGTLALLATPTTAHADEWNKKYTFSGKPDLRVETGDGDVEIASGPANEITARVDAQGYKINDSDLHVEESQDGNRIQILVKTRNHFTFFSFGHHGLRVQVIVPAQSDMEIRTGDGNVRCSPVEGKISIDTGDGNLTATGLHGDIHLHSGDGHIDGQDFAGNLNVDTGDGHINVTGRFDVLYLKTGDGGIDAQADPGSKIANAWTLHSGDGHINLKVPSDFNADLDAHTGDGHITLDFPVSVSGALSESRIHGKLNAGGGTLAVSSGDGSIHIAKL
jgi:DUF4097 and DUF4098 domain-containing protein YvlB